MDRLVRIQGIGKVNVEPDYVIIHISVDGIQVNYQDAINEVNSLIFNLEQAMKEIGFTSKDFKVVDFRVSRIIDEYKANANGKVEFIKSGFKCSNRIKLAFDLDNEKLSQTIAVIGNCIAEPKASISFTVKDEEAVKTSLLEEAAKSARKKAEILCSSAGGELGELISIDYDWDDFNIFSPTHFDPFMKFQTAQIPSPLSPTPVDYAELSKPVTPVNANNPDSIELKEKAMFVWEIK